MTSGFGSTCTIESSRQSHSDLSREALVQLHEEDVSSCSSSYTATSAPRVRSTAQCSGGVCVCVGVVLTGREGRVVFRRRIFVWWSWHQEDMSDATATPHTRTHMHSTLMDATTSARIPLCRVVFDMDGTLTELNLDFAEMKRRAGIPPSEDILSSIAAMAPDRAVAANAVRAPPTPTPLLHLHLHR
jgi:hypothetical protein